MGTYSSLENIKPPPGFTLDKPQEKQPEDFTDLLQFQDVGYKQPPIEEEPKPPPGYTVEKSAKKLWTGKLGAKIGGKTIVEHIGDYVSDAWKKRTEVPPSPPMFEDGKLSKEYSRGAFENVSAVAKTIFGTMPPPQLTGESPHEYIQRIKQLAEDKKPYRSVMAPPKTLPQKAGGVAKGIGEGIVDLGMFLPATVTKVAKDPSGTIYHDLFGIAATGAAAAQGISGIKGKAPTKKPIEIKPPTGYKLDKPITRAPAPTEVAKLEASGYREIGAKKPTATDVAKIKANPYEEFHSGFDLRGEIKKSLEYLQTGDIKGYIPTLGERTSRRLGKSKLSVRLPEEPQPGLPGMEKILSIIKKFKPMRAEQEALYTKEHAQRMAKGKATSEELSGEAWAEAYIGAHYGPMEKVPFRAIRQLLTQKERDGLFQQIRQSPKLTDWERLPTINALRNVFGKDEAKLKLPTEGELALLGKVFPKEFVQTLRKQWPLWKRIQHGVMEASGIPRSVMAAYDFSFGLRQGAFLAPRFPKEFGKAFASQFKYFGSQKAFEALRQEIAARPTHKLMRQGKLALTDMDYTLASREEAFMSHWAEKIPGVRQSGRAYTGMANKLRADVFDNFVKYQEKLGLDPYNNPRLVRATADFINNATGRGKLKKLESSAVILNNLFFSPRLILSRLKLLNPVYYAKLPKGVRGRALQSLVSFAGAGMSIISMAKLAEKAFPDDIKVGADPFSSDFGKIKIGNTRIDVWGGFQQYIRTAAQSAGGKIVSTTTGKVTKVGEGYKPLTRPAIAWRFAEYKFAPVVSFFWDLYRGRTSGFDPIDFGEPDPTKNPILSRLMPMVAQDIYEIGMDDPKLLPLSILGIFGIGLQTYPPGKPKPKKTTKKKGEFWY